MKSCHGANPIFFNKKIKIGHLEHSLPSPLTSDNISYLPYLPPPQSGRYICITPKVMSAWIFLQSVFLQMIKKWIHCFLFSKNPKNYNFDSLLYDSKYSLEIWYYLQKNRDATRAGDDERRTNYEWPKLNRLHLVSSCVTLGYDIYQKNRRITFSTKLLWKISLKIHT